MNNTRNRAWRRFKNKVHGKIIPDYPVKDSQDNWVPPKNWKWLGRRWHKLRRAKQLGFDYSRLNWRQLTDKEVESND